MEEIGITCLDFNGRQHSIRISNIPDTCPICHHAIHPVGPFHSYINNHGETNYVQLVLRCTRRDCQHLFIANYTRVGATPSYKFVNSTPKKILPKSFSETLLKLSPQFIKIYNEAHSAESYELTEICGVGYRKALEFLIKDYLIQCYPDKRQEIKSKFLGVCINDYITNENIKMAAKRAAWLGNDETHYERIWVGKDLQDLKRLIDLTVRWIEMEQMTKEAVQDMPGK
jgi:hypothetical protein